MTTPQLSASADLGIHESQNSSPDVHSHDVHSMEVLMEDKRLTKSCRKHAQNIHVAMPALCAARGVLNEGNKSSVGMKKVRIIKFDTQSSAPGLLSPPKI